MGLTKAEIRKKQIDNILEELDKSGFPNEFTKTNWRIACKKITTHSNYICYNLLDLAEKNKLIEKINHSVYKTLKK